MDGTGRLPSPSRRTLGFRAASWFTIPVMSSFPWRCSTSCEFLKKVFAFPAVGEAKISLDAGVDHYLLLTTWRASACI